MVLSSFTFGMHFSDASKCQAVIDKSLIDSPRSNDGIEMHLLSRFTDAIPHDLAAFALYILSLMGSISFLPCDQNVCTLFFFFFCPVGWFTFLSSRESIAQKCKDFFIANRNWH